MTSPESPKDQSWNNQLLVKPHEVSDKRQRVKNMFAAIAPSYDLNNRLHSLWMDQRWRRKAVKIAQLKPNDQVVDVACGTGDLTICFADALRKTASAKGTAREVIGVDFTYEMLPIAARKKQGHDAFAPVRFVNGDAQNPLQSQPKRFSLWEIHPVSQFLVCKRTANNCDIDTDSDWTPLEKSQ